MATAKFTEQVTARGAGVASSAKITTGFCHFATHHVRTLNSCRLAKTIEKARTSCKEDVSTKGCESLGRRGKHLAGLETKPGALSTAVYKLQYLSSSKNAIDISDIFKSSVEQ